MRQWLTEIRIAHGEPKAKQALAALFHQLYQQHESSPAATTTGGAGDTTEQDGCHD